MNVDWIGLIIGIFILAVGIICIIRPAWYRNLREIRIDYSRLGDRTANTISIVVGIICFVFGLSLIIQSLPLGGVFP